MNSKTPAFSSDAIANESIVIVDDDGKRRCPNLSILDSAMFSSSTRRLSQKTEQSLYPDLSDISNLPTIVTADAVWAATSRRPSEQGSNSKALPTDQGHTQVSASDTREKSAASDDASFSSVESQPSFERKTVEVTPGQFVPLRGSEETMLALENGQVTSVTCIFCNIDLVVHAAASMIICPDCEMISPLGVDVDKTSLGLGLRRESLELSSSHFQDGGKGLFAESEERLQTSNLNREPDEDSLSS